MVPICCYNYFYYIRNLLNAFTTLSTEKEKEKFVKKDARIRTFQEQKQRQERKKRCAAKKKKNKNS